MSLSVNIKEAFYGNKKVLNDIAFNLEDGDMLGIIGETGAGKTTVAKIVSGLYRLYPLNFKGFVKTSRKISYIPQNITESLDPLFTIEYQMREIKDDIKQIRDKLTRVGFKGVDRVLKSYPHNLSGGMKQRVLIAMALLEGEILIADEFTSALDRTTKLQVVKLLNELNERLDATIIFITHDIELLDYKGFLMVMFMGEMVEFGDVEEIKSNPIHPYMKSLLKCVPSDNMHYTKNRFKEIIINKKAMCPFVDLCDRADEICYKIKPQLKKNGTRIVRCHF